MGKGRKKKSPPGRPSDAGGETADRGVGTPPETLPYNEAEWAALDGWWAEGGIDRLLWFASGHLRVHDLGRFGQPETDAIDCELAEQGGVRLIFNVGQEPRLETSTPVFEYRLRGDVLELNQVLPFTLLQAPP